MFSEEDNNLTIARKVTESITQLKLVGKFGVITSYSIHYTKLYELFVTLFCTVKMKPPYVKKVSRYGWLTGGSKS